MPVPGYQLPPELAGAPVTQVPSLPASLPGSTPLGRHMQAAPNALLFSIPSVASYLVRDGKSIAIAIEPGADPDAVELFLHGTAFGALLHQRGELPLHASTLVPPGGSFAVALCGDSGLGKSTLAATLRQRGWTFVADDMTRVTWDGRQPLAWPSRKAAKLWHDTCLRLGLDPARLRPVRTGMDKYYVPITGPAAEQPVPLGLILELSFREGILRRIDAQPSRLAILSRQTFRARQIRPMGMLAEHLRIVARISASCALAELGGARARSVEELATSVEEALQWLPASS